jgi:hypothetical protein
MNADRSSQTSANEKSPAEHGSNGNAPTLGDTGSAEEEKTTELDALKLLLKQFQELREYFSYYLTAKADGVRLSLRNFSLRIVLASLAFIVVAGLIVTANWLVLCGTAEGFGVLCGGRSWAGKLIAGSLWLVMLGLCVCFTVVRRTTASRKRTVQKYEERKNQQQTDFGHDVAGQSAAAFTGKK